MVGTVRALVACFGNVLRLDDGFGVAVAERLVAAGVPEGVAVMDVGIGGIHMVHDLLGEELGALEALIIVDACDLGRPPGTVVVQIPDVVDVGLLDDQARRDVLADMHYATPERALMLARALGALPVTLLVVGCQPLHVDDVGIGLSAPVAGALDTAVEEVRRAVRDLGVPWS